jgi:hypothetical protein
MQLSVFKSFVAAIVCLALAGIAGAADHYAAPSGTAGGDGTIGNPWDLQTALNQPASVQPGDTIWVRGGSYNGQFNGNLNGTVASPIVVRNYNGEHATILGLLNDQFVLYVGGSYTWYWGLEISTSCAVRVISGANVCPFGIGDYGPGNKFINDIIHDSLQGFSGYNSSPDTELYGNLVYYNGDTSTDRNHGHGIYAQNSTGQKTISDNFVGDNADEGIQIYGSGSAAIVNFTLAGNVLYNSSSWPSPSYQYNRLSAGGATRKNIVVQNNYSYYTPGAGGYVQFGQYTLGQDMSITNNVFANGYITVGVFEQSGPVVFTGNKVTASPDALRITTLDLWAGQSTSSYTWDNNAYYDTSQAHFYEGFTSDGSNFSGINTSFPGWQGMTQFDAHSTYQPSAPTGVWTYVRPNKYEAKRANVIIYNWDLLPTVFVDLSSVLSPGDQYTIQDAQNFYGPPVAAGVYSGNLVGIQMTGLTKATPVGFAAPAHTAPQFGTFVVLPAGATATQSITQPPVTPPAGSGSSSPSPGAGTPPPVPQAAVTFVRSDIATQGNWQGSYGADGYAISQGPQSNPAYATFAVQGQGNWTWNASTADPRALAVPGAERLATTWYSTPGLQTFGFDVNITGGSAHQFALYALDWDAKGRSETVQVVDTATNTVLDTRSITSFTNGLYLVWNISGHVTINITPTSGPNGVVSGVFFGTGSNGGSTGSGSNGGTVSNTSTGSSVGNAGTAASFVLSDTVTQGSWQGKYGADGYDLAGSGTQSIPVYAPTSVQNASTYAWAASTTDLRALQTLGTPGRFAATWFNSTAANSFSIDVNITDGNVHQVALYAMDWDSKGRAQSIQVVNAATSAVLDSRTLSGFANGVYLVWNLSGHVTIKVTSTGGPNAVVSGLLFGTGVANTNTTAAAAFIATDASTQGNWKGVYGNDGYDIPDTNTNAMPAYVAFTPQGQANYIWTSNSAAPQDLQVASSSPINIRQATCWFTLLTTSYSLDINITDGNPHQFEVYALDWDSLGRAETITVSDAVSGTVLDTRTVTNFSQGIYYIWKLAGHVKVTVTQNNTVNAVLSGAFFD